MTVLVLPGSTRVGRHVALTLAADGVSTRALVRDSTPVDDLFAAGVDLAFGDLHSPESLAAALHGVETVVMATPPVPDLPTIEAGVIAAIGAAGVRRVVKSSAAAADPDAPDLFARMHYAGEQLLRSGGFDFTIVRPVFFRQNLLEWRAAVRAEHRFGTPMAPSERIAMVDLRDHAELVAELATASGHSGRAYLSVDLHLPRWNTVAAELSRATGTTIGYATSTTAEFTDQMVLGGSTVWAATHAAHIYANMATQRSIAIRQMLTWPYGPFAIRAILGRAPRSLAGFADEYASGFVG